MVSQKNSTVIYFARIARRVKFRSVFRAPSEKFKILAIPDALAHGKSYEHSSAKKRDDHKLCAKLRSVEFRSVFRAPSRKFKILVIPDVLAHGKSYEQGFMKNVTVINFPRSRPRVEFRSVFVHHLKNSKYLVEFRSVFRAPYWKFKILAIPDVLANGKSYQHSFTRKYDGHKLCVKSYAESSFDRFFIHHLKNSKYWSFLTY
ncbi:hypothetical protein B296_00027672 [Ensete ventricosum]|uniref:Uncharacterized protein n=1 Tax=Ensete ventricosum TaxID=4639 RepID=A0A426XUA1_ENSVE|nr:hypothetical protein B296_00027672 [Ensete ventricosum]